MFSFIIKSTIEIKDHSNTIKVGDTLYAGDVDEQFETEVKAASRADDVLQGLDGSAAYNQACETAVVEVVRV